MKKKNCIIRSTNYFYGIVFTFA